MSKGKLPLKYLDPVDWFEKMCGRFHEDIENPDRLNENDDLNINNEDIVLLESMEDLKLVHKDIIVGIN